MEGSDKRARELSNNVTQRQFMEVDYMSFAMFGLGLLILLAEAGISVCDFYWILIHLYQSRLH